MQNAYFNHSLGDDGVAAARFGDWKIMVGMACSAKVQPWPTPGDRAVPFGKTGGWIESGTNHARSPLLDHVDAATGLSTLQSTADDSWADWTARLADSTGGATPDPHCATGVPKGGVDYHDHGVVSCCAKECGVCGVQEECQRAIKSGTVCPCARRPGGPDNCCVYNIQTANRSCHLFPPPCVVSRKPAPAPGPSAHVCLYHLPTDASESNNLAASDSHAALFAELLRKLHDRGSTGPPLDVAFVGGVGMTNKTAAAATCQQENRTGFLEPLDWRSP